LRNSPVSGGIEPDLVVRPRNGSYKISRDLAEAHGLDPEVSYKSKSDCLAVVRDLAPELNSNTAKAPLPFGLAVGVSNFWVGFVVAVAISVAVTMSYFSEMLKGSLGLIDDHEYLNFLGDDREISWSEVPLLLDATEAGTWGEGTRFRPTYFLLRILQTKLFGLEGSLWFGSRLIIFAVTIALLGLAVWRLIGHALDEKQIFATPKLAIQVALSFWVIALTASMASWSDIITRLGPSEIYVALGFSFMVFGLTHSGLAKFPYFGWVLASLGVTLAITTKENGILLLAPLVTIMVLQVRTQIRSFGALITLLLPVGAGLWVLIGVLLGMSKAGGDVYGEQRSLDGLFDALLANPYSWITVLVALSVVVLETMKVASMHSTDIADNQNFWLGAIRRHPFSILALLSVVLLAGESYFYQNSLSQGVFSPGRYGIGSELAAVSAVVIATVLAISFVGIRREPSSLPLGLVAGSLSLGVVLASLAPIGRAATEFPELSRGTVQYLSYQMSVMEQAGDYLSEFKNSQVLLVVDEPYDYERVMSLPLFLENLADRNAAFFVQYQIPKELEVDPLQADLASRLADISTEGFMERPWQVSPIGQLNSGFEVLCFYFGQEVSLPNCTQTIGIG